MGKSPRIHKKELLAWLDASLPKLRAGMTLSELAASRGSWPSNVCKAMKIHRGPEYRAAMIEGRKRQIEAAAGDLIQWRRLVRNACIYWPEAFTYPYRKPPSEWGKSKRKRNMPVPVDAIDVLAMAGAPTICSVSPGVSDDDDAK